MRFSNYTISKIKGPSTRDQISKSFELAKKLEYHTIILGSSKIYRGINPDLLDSAFNFSHDNDVFNQCYYKLLFALQNKKKIKTVILGYDYFGFSYLSDSRNYIYKDYFDSEYLEDFRSNGVYSSLKESDSSFNTLVTMNFTNTVKPFLEGFFYTDSNRPYLTDRGQYKRFGIANKFSMQRPVDKANILEIQLNYFKRIIKLCEQNKLRLFIVMVPTRQIELDSYSNNQKRTVDSIAESVLNSFKTCRYLKYEKDSSYHLEDFEDAIHLNAWGADKFTHQLKMDLSKYNLN